MIVKHWPKFRMTSVLAGVLVFVSIVLLNIFYWYVNALFPFTEFGWPWSFYGEVIIDGRFEEAYWEWSSLWLDVGVALLLSGATTIGFDYISRKGWTRIHLSTLIVNSVMGAVMLWFQMFYWEVLNNSVRDGGHRYGWPWCYYSVAPVQYIDIDPSAYWDWGVFLRVVLVALSIHLGVTVCIEWSIRRTLTGASMNQTNRHSQNDSSPSSNS
jgi:hypothetical protein